MPYFWFQGQTHIWLPLCLRSLKFEAKKPLLFGTFNACCYLSWILAKSERMQDADWAIRIFPITWLDPINRLFRATDQTVRFNLLDRCKGTVIELAWLAYTAFECLNIQASSAFNSNRLFWCHIAALSIFANSRPRERKSEALPIVPLMWSSRTLCDVCLRFQYWTALASSRLTVFIYALALIASALSTFSL